MNGIMKLLHNVPDEYYPFYSWIWNDKIEKEEIVNQLIKMKVAGITNIYIISESKKFRPVYMPTYAEPEYLSDEYMELFSFAVEEAQKQGMHVWIYDEDGWPSGSCGGKTAETRENLRVKKFVKENDTYVLKDMSGEKFYPNLMLEESTDAFIKETHEKYKSICADAFGKTVTGVFTDEPHIDFFSYDEKIADSFEERYGYRIEEYFKKELSKEKYNIAQLDWREHCTNLFAENYFKKIRDWCRENGLIFTGHVNMDHTGAFVNSCGNILQILRNFDIPGIDVIFRQIYPDEEGETVYSLGNDFGTVLTCENKFFPRFASSAARQAGVQRALAECFAVYGAMRYNKMRYVINFLIARRINLINIMSISYGKHGHVAGGMRPNFIAEAPDYFGLKKLNDFIATECFLMSQGEALIKNALYIPIRQWWQNDEILKSGSEEFFCLGRIMEESGADFDIIDDYAICNVGISSFDAIYICGWTLASERVKIELEKFISNGGKVYTTTETDICGAVMIKADEVAGTVVPANNIFECNKDIRTSVRLLENGEKLIFIYNEGLKKTKVRMKRSSESKVYEIDLNEKKLYNSVGCSEIVLESGEEKFFYLTENFYQAENRISTNREIVPIFENATIVSRFSAEDSIVSLKEESTSLKDENWPGNDFSGQVRYVYKFEMKEEDLNNDAFLEIHDVNNCCDVKINGIPLDIGIFFPIHLKIPKTLLRKVNKLDIVIGNTVAEEMAKLESDKEYIYGSYHHMARTFEKESIGGGVLGKVLIKLI